MVVCAVDVEVWCGVPVFAVGERVLNAEDAPVFVGAEDEIVGSDGEGFDFGEDAELAENFGRVRRDLNSGSHLGGVSESEGEDCARMGRKGHLLLRVGRLVREL